MALEHKQLNVNKTHCKLKKDRNKFEIKCVDSKKINILK